MANLSDPGQQWSSRLGFLLASIGFAVGLGNIWRFPYVTGENGGGAFVIVYLLCVFAVGVPILMAEIMIGRRGRSAPPESVSVVAQSEGSSSRWSVIGYLGIATATLILFAYTVVAGWVFYYLYLALVEGFNTATAVTSASTFDSLLTDIPKLFVWAAIALAAAAAIVYAGLQKGIERAVTILMPALFALLVILALFNVFNGGMGEALAYLFTPDFSKLTPQMFLIAVGQAFFSIGVGMAGMMMFGAYLPKSVNIGNSAVLIVIADTTVALVAGLVIFPMVFNYGLDPASGSGLIFQTLPVAFAGMPMGRLVAILFFLLLSVAAVTSIVGLFEPVSTWMANRFGVTRQRAVAYFAAVCLAGSTVSVLSYNVWKSVSIGSMSLNLLMDYLPNQVFLPLGGLLIALFAGWIVSPTSSRDELAMQGGAFVVWHRLLKWLVVPVVMVILVTGLG